MKEKSVYEVFMTVTTVGRDGNASTVTHVLSFVTKELAEKRRQALFNHGLNKDGVRVYVSTTALYDGGAS